MRANYKIWATIVKEVHGRLQAGEYSQAAKVDPYTVSPSLHLHSADDDSLVGAFKHTRCNCYRRHCIKRPCLACFGDSVSCLELVPKNAIGKCPWCPMTMKNNNKYWCHLVREHGYRAPERPYVTNENQHGNKQYQTGTRKEQHEQRHKHERSRNEQMRNTT